MNNTLCLLPGLRHKPLFPHNLCGCLSTQPRSCQLRLVHTPWTARCGPSSRCLPGKQTSTQCGPLTLKQRDASSIPCVSGDAAPPLIQPVINLGLDVAGRVGAHGKTLLLESLQEAIYNFPVDVALVFSFSGPCDVKEKINGFKPPGKLWN